MDQPDLPRPSWEPPGAPPQPPSPVPNPMSTPFSGEAVVVVRPAKPVLLAVVFALFGGFVWLIVGLVGFNAVAGFGPRVTEDAVILSIEIEPGTGTGTSSTRASRWVEGETASGRTWRLASDEAHDVASRDGYPMDVEVVISTWTGNTLVLRGPGFEVDRSGGAWRVLWLFATVVVAAGALLGAWGLGRKEHRVAVVSYLLLAPLWLWLGFALMRAYRT